MSCRLLFDQIVPHLPSLDIIWSRQPPPAVRVTKIASSGPVIGNPLSTKTHFDCNLHLKDNCVFFCLHHWQYSIFHVCGFFFSFSCKGHNLECCQKCCQPHFQQNGAVLFVWLVFTVFGFHFCFLSVSSHCGSVFNYSASAFVHFVSLFCCSVSFWLFFCSLILILRVFLVILRLRDCFVSQSELSFSVFVVILFLAWALSNKSPPGAPS